MDEQSFRPAHLRPPTPEEIARFKNLYFLKPSVSLRSRIGNLLLPSRLWAALRWSRGHTAPPPVAERVA